MDFNNLTRRRSPWCINSLFVGIALIILANQALNELNNDQRIHNLALHGWKMEGEITRKYITTSQIKGHTIDNYFYRYAFIVNGNRITATHSMLGEYDYDKDYIGEPVTVLYDHDNPLDCTIYPPCDIGDCTKFIVIARFVEVIGVIFILGTVAIKLMFSK